MWTGGSTAPVFVMYRSALKSYGAEVVLEEKRGDHRHDRERRDSLSRHQLQHDRRKRERPLQKNAGTSLHRQEQLIQAVVERQRQHVENRVVVSDSGGSR